MKTRFLFALLTFAPLAGGCSDFYLTQGPPPAATPTPVPTVGPAPMDPAEGTTVPGMAAPLDKGIAMNAPDSPSLPDAFRVARIDSPRQLVLQSIDIDTKGQVVPGTADINNPVVLAGIVVPAPNTPGYEEAMRTVTTWTSGLNKTSPNLDVYIDPKYPTDTSGHRLVQVFFKGRAGLKASAEPISLSLNRMMIRSGYAVVDMYSPTSFDQHQWLLDEAYARTKKLGLWKFGIGLQQRVPPRPAVVVVPGLKSKVIVQAGIQPKTSTTITKTTTKTNGVPVPTATPNIARSPSIPQDSRSLGGTTTDTGTRRVILPPPNNSAPAGGVAPDSSSTGTSGSSPGMGSMSTSG